MTTPAGRIASDRAFRIALCDKVLGELPFERQDELAASLGDGGLEIAPFTLAEAPERMTTGEAARVRRVVEEAGSSSPGCAGCSSSPRACR